MSSLCSCYNDRLRMGIVAYDETGSDLANMLSSKGISKVKKTLKKNGPMTRTALEPYVKDLTAKQPFMQEQINVTNPRQFLDSILPYMVKQKMITEEKVNGKIVYQIRKD